jgi:hypothetical protein
MTGIIGRGRGMKDVELYGRVRYAVRIEGLSERAAARRFGIDPRTVSDRRRHCRLGNNMNRRRMDICSGHSSIP